MIYIVLSVTGMIATLFIKSTWNWHKQLTVIALALSAGVILYWIMIAGFEFSGITEKSSASPGSRIPFLEIILYFVMLAGISAKFFYDAIEEAGPDKRKKIRLLKRQLFKPMLVSPMVFGGIYGSMDENTSLILLVIFAFQNGFFWQTVLYKTKAPA